jgi:hypothetical protein
MGWFKERSRRSRANHLKERVESGRAQSKLTSLSMTGTVSGATVPIPSEPVLSWGYALEHEVYPEVGPNSTSVVYALTETGIVYQVLPEVPPQMRSPRARAAGMGPAEWKEMAEESTARIAFDAVGDARVGEAIDGAWQLFFFPKGRTSESDMLGLGVMQVYGGMVTRELAEFVAKKLHVQPEYEAWKD